MVLTCICGESAYARLKVLPEHIGGTMCGIVGYIGERDATEIIMNGLKKLEYRGYDSAGIAVNTGKKIEIRRDAGKLENLEQLIAN